MAAETVTITIDGRKLAVPKGTNLIEAARMAGLEIPHYCYHPNLSIAGNCRMCQVEVTGRPKLEIGCNTTVADGMEVKTQLTSQKVKDAQAATLEFILVNHPLDCTVCDQAGHCKLQDYHYDYNARPSRFLENKEHKVKATPLGPTVMLDGERCIMCTRCIRFCDEITGTSELGMLNRGDRSVIAVHPGRELNNPLSGTVVDLCPVGALTHRAWRFNTRVWFTKQQNGICPGCSTGCNVKVGTRDDQVVLVKARPNAEVNKEWLCDEGRYGFGRFLPASRLTSARVAGKVVALEDGVRSAAQALKGKEVLVFASPDLLTEEFYVLREFLAKHSKSSKVVLGYRERSLTAVEAILMSPDYAANSQGADFMKVVATPLQSAYEAALQDLKAGRAQTVLIVGEKGILAKDATPELAAALSRIEASVYLGADAGHPAATAARVALPGRSVLEKAGLLMNRQQRLQYTDRFLNFPEGTEPEWRLLNRIAQACGNRVVEAAADRDLTIAFLAGEPRLAGLSIARIRDGGVCMKSYRPAQAGLAAQAAGA